MTVREVTSILESFAPLAFQEDYDNSGLIVGDANMEVTGVLLTIDVT
ncbi:Nif3-like dinuclear metal center hexameric protein, partial [Tenuifilum sp.]|nr:Nif3-like dinuclear metal center hexameric protein [Tenuifilum sp.]